MGLSEGVELELRPESHKGAGHGIPGLMPRGRTCLVRSRDHLGRRRFQENHRRQGQLPEGIGPEPGSYSKGMEMPAEHLEAEGLHDPVAL